MPDRAVSCGRAGHYDPTGLRIFGGLRLLWRLSMKLEHMLQRAGQPQPATERVGLSIALTNLPRDRIRSNIEVDGDPAKVRPRHRHGVAQRAAVRSELNFMSPLRNVGFLPARASRA